MLPASAEPSARIVYIVGARNCGSTLLDAVLGNARTAQSLGEAGGFQRYEPGVPCSCAEPSEACRLCRAALATVTDAVSVEEFRSVSSLPLRERRFWWLRVGTRSRRRYAQLADLVFDGCVGATGKKMLIDSSKNASRAAALAFDSRYEVFIVHLVRDGRGHLSSRRRRASIDGTRFNPVSTVVMWLAKNLLIAKGLAPRVPAGHYLVTRYEDLVSDPVGELERIGDFAGFDTRGLAAAATSTGLPRGQLFEPVRRTDYTSVRLDPKRLSSQRMSKRANAVFWMLGGFLSARWGYDKRQSYLRAAGARGGVA